MPGRTRRDTGHKGPYGRWHNQLHRVCNGSLRPVRSTRFCRTQHVRDRACAHPNAQAHKKPPGAANGCTQWSLSAAAGLQPAPRSPDLNISPALPVPPSLYPTPPALAGTGLEVAHAARRRGKLERLPPWRLRGDANCVVAFRHLRERPSKRLRQRDRQR